MYVSQTLCKKKLQFYFYKNLDRQRRSDSFSFIQKDNYFDRKE